MGAVQYAHMNTPFNWTEDDAYGALRDLKGALKDAGIVLPSFSVERAATDRPLMELGRCRPDVARQLATVIRAGVEVLQRAQPEGLSNGSNDGESGSGHH
jgi:hypothetical protein